MPNLNKPERILLSTGLLLVLNDFGERSNTREEQEMLNAFVSGLVLKLGLNEEFTKILKDAREIVISQN